MIMLIKRAVLIVLFTQIVESSVWNLNSTLECIFHMNGTNNDLCQTVEKFTLSPVGTKAWTSQQKSLIKSTGPQSFYDYVGYNVTNDFNYAVYDSKTTRKTGFQTSLNTPVIETSGKSVCISFAYYLYGTDLGSLYVVEKYNNTDYGKRIYINENDPTWTVNTREKLIARGEQGMKWIQRSYQAATGNQELVQFLFTAVRGNGDNGDIAIDSIKVDGNVTSCPLDGNWGSWNFGQCDVHCGIGEQTRSRNCDNPSPQEGGQSCWRKNFTTSNTEEEMTSCIATQCSKVVVTCLENCTLSSKGVIQPTFTTDNQLLNLVFTYTMTRDFNNITLKFDDVILMKADKDQIDVTPNPLFDFGAKTLIKDGSSYNITFTFVNYNWTMHDNKLFKYILSYDNNLHIGVVKTYSGVDGNWATWSETKCSDKCINGKGKRERLCNSPSPQRGGKECVKKDWTRGSYEDECAGICSGAADVTVACITGCTIENYVLTPNNKMDEMINIAFKFTIDNNYDSFVIKCDNITCVNITQNRQLQSNSSIYFDNKKIVEQGDNSDIMLTMLKLNSTVYKKRVFDYALKYNGKTRTGRVVLDINPVSGGSGSGTNSSLTIDKQDPVHGAYSPWNSWHNVQCTKTCGGGYMTRMRKCDRPKPQYGGNPCDGPYNQTRPCNSMRCPNPYAGVRREVFISFDQSNISDFRSVIGLSNFPNNPDSSRLLSEFKMVDTAPLQNASLIRYWAYYAATFTGTHKFHLTCSSLCNIYVSLYDCSRTSDVLKVLKGNYELSEFASNITTIELPLTRKYRYCIKALHQVEQNTSRSWFQIGITLPSDNRYVPLSKTKGGVFTAPDDGFTFIDPVLINVTYNKAVVRTYCPDLFYWTYKASVAWVRPENNSYAPLMGFSYENSTNINVTSLNSFTEQVMHITCVGEEYAVFLTDFPVFKTKQGPPTKPPGNFTVTLQPPTTMLITWGDVPEDGRSGFITGFQFEYSSMSYDGKKVVGEWTDYDIKSASIRKFTYKFPKTFYKWFSFRIAGKTIAGAGVPTKIIKRRTAESVPSSPPATISFKSENSTKLQVIWTDIPKVHENGIITAFNLSIKLNGTKQWDDYIINATLRDYTFYGLQKWSFYWIRIAGQTRLGQGDSSNDILYRTSEAFPDKAPKGFNLTLAGNDTLNVTWENVGSFKYGNIIGYAISYAEYDFSVWNWETKIVDAKRNSTQLKDLNAYTKYVVKVAARSNAGIGVYSNSLIERTGEGVPKFPPANFTCFNTSSSSIRCDWLQPTASYSSGILHGYQIFYHVADCEAAQLKNCSEKIWFNDTIHNSSQTSINVFDLHPFAYYEFQIFLFNSQWESPRTKELKSQTDEDTPTGKPQKVSGFPNTESSVELFWEPIPFGTARGILLEYVCFYRKINDLDIATNTKIHYNKRTRRAVTGYYLKSNDNNRYTLYDGEYMYPEEVVYIPIDAQNAIIDNLDPYQRYTFRIAARTSKGIGPTADLRVDTQPGFPIVAPNLSVYDHYDMNKIRLSWSMLPWNHSRGHLMNYYVTYSAVKSGGDDIFHYERTEDFVWLLRNPRQVELTGLEPFTKYEIRIAAVSERGIGLFSSQPVYASTCNCPASIKTNFMRKEPYFSISKRTLESGIAKCCDTCRNGWGKSQLDWNSDGNSGKSEKTNYTALKTALNTGTNLNFPIQYDTRRKTYEEKPYVPIIRSSGLVVFGRVHDYLSSSSFMMVDAVASLWAYGLLLLSLILCYGLVMWIIQCNPLQLSRDTQDDFPDDFTHGAGAGIWWAVITMLHVGYGRIVARGAIDRIFSIPAIIFGLVLTCLITSVVTVYFTSYCVTRAQADLMFKKVGVPEGSYDRYFINRKGGWVRQWNNTALDLQKELIDGKIDQIAVDSYYAVNYKSNPQMSDKIVAYRVYERDSSFGVVLTGDVKHLGYCLNEHMRYDDVLANYTDPHGVFLDVEDEIQMKVDALGKYATTKWVISVLVCFGLIIVAFICGIVYEVRRRQKYGLRLRIHEAEGRHKKYLKMGTNLVDSFKDDCVKKLEDVEVKHAFQRIDLKIEMRKNLKYLSPNDVFKYKL